jgi:transposase
MQITTIGIDLAKAVFQVHGVDAHGKTVLKKQLKRTQMPEFFANLSPCLIGMEACGSAHYWARKLQAFGHTVRLMAPQFVKPYVKTNKNDAADAEALCEAVTRPTMRFVPVKHVDQQAVLAVHRVRQALVKARTAQANQIRGLLSEFGLIIPQGIAHISQRVPEMLDNAGDDVPGAFRELMQRMLDHLKSLDQQVGELERQIRMWHRSSDSAGGLYWRCQAVCQWPSACSMVGPGPQAAFHWWQIQSVGHQQARGLLFAHIADPWRQGRHPGHRAQGHHAGLACSLTGPASQERGGGRIG